MDTTYFGTDEAGAWAHDDRMQEIDSTDGKTMGKKVAPRSRVFKTVPSKDQALDPNGVRSSIQAHSQLQQLGMAPGGLRNLINAVKSTGARTASSQVIQSEQFGPPPVPGGRTDIGLIGSRGSAGEDFNWHEYGYSNWKSTGPDGTTRDSLGNKKLGSETTGLVVDRSGDRSTAANEWGKGTLGKDGKIVSRPKPLPGDQKLPLGDEWTKPPAPTFG